MDTVKRFCRDCYQTTPHVRYPGGATYECSVCKKSGRAIWMKESKKEDTAMDIEEMVLKILGEKGSATANEISAELKVPAEDVTKVLARLETAGMLLMVA